jgi:hypothetical protein
LPLAHWANAKHGRIKTGQTSRLQALLVATALLFDREKTCKTKPLFATGRLMIEV